MATFDKVRDIVVDQLGVEADEKIKTVQDVVSYIDQNK